MPKLQREIFGPANFDAGKAKRKRLYFNVCSTPKKEQGRDRSSGKVVSGPPENTIRNREMTQTAVADKEHVRKEAGTHNPLLATWHSVIGKKIVMATTGAVLVLFVLAHMAGNLKIFGGADMINAYSRSLREMAMPRIRVRAIAVDCGWIVLTDLRAAA